MKGYSYLTDVATSNSIDDANFDGLVTKINEKFNNPELGDNIARTGLAIAKQSKLRDSGFLSDLGSVNKSQLQIWGDGHLNTQTDLNLINEIADNPRPTVERILTREMAYLLVKGLSMSEATEKVALLRIAMAGIITCSVKSDSNGTGYAINPLLNRKPLFIDDEILGFSSKGKTASDIRSNCRALAYNSYFELTDRNGKFKI